MTIRSAIRLERKRLTEQASAAEAKLDALRGKIAALDNALAALDHEAPPDKNGASAPKRKTRTYKGRVSLDKRKAEVLDYCRQIEPRLRSGSSRLGIASEGVTAAELRGKYGIPHSSAAVAIDALLAEGRLRKIDETAGGQPIVRYKPTKVRPGEEVKA